MRPRSYNDRQVREVRANIATLRARIAHISEARAEARKALAHIRPSWWGRILPCAKQRDDLRQLWDQNIQSAIDLMTSEINHCDAQALALQRYMDTITGNYP